MDSNESSGEMLTDLPKSVELRVKVEGKRGVEGKEQGGE
jgi:hypothetical protein